MSSQYAAMTLALKSILKQRRISYRELGDAIGMSESGVKKALTSSDGSFSRIERMSESLGMSFYDLVQVSSKAQSVTDYVMPVETQQALLDDLDCFRVFWKLFYDEVSPEATQEALRMKPPVFWKHVRKLDRLALLRVSVDNKITLPKRAHTVWTSNGPLVNWMLHTWSKQLIDEVAADYSGPDTTLGMRFYRLTPASIAELRAQVRELVRGFGERSLRERLTHADSELSSARLLAVVRSGGWGQND